MSSWTRGFLRYSFFPLLSEIPMLLSSCRLLVRNLLCIVTSMEKYCLRKHFSILLMPSPCHQIAMLLYRRPDKIGFLFLTSKSINSHMLSTCSWGKNLILLTWRPSMITGFFVSDNQGNIMTTALSWLTTVCPFQPTRSMWQDMSQRMMNGLMSIYAERQITIRCWLGSNLGMMRKSR